MGTGLEIAAIALLAAGAGATAYSAYSTTQNKPPAVPKPTPPPPPPAPAEKPPAVPTETTIGEGQAKLQARKSRQFGLEHTILAQQPSLGETGGAPPLLQRRGGVSQSALGRRGSG